MDSRNASKSCSEEEQIQTSKIITISSNNSYPPHRRDDNSQTPCHAAVLGGRPPNFPEGITRTLNPVTGTCRLAIGCYNYLSYYLHDARIQCKCLQHLLKFGGDLTAKNDVGETPQDIATKLRKIDILEMIEFFCELIPTLIII